MLREMIETTMIESSSSIEGDSSMLNSSDTFADGAEGTYTTSTSEIYRQRNVHCHPSIPRWAIQSQMTTTSTSSILETESVSLLTGLADNSAPIQHHFIAIRPGTVTFVGVEELRLVFWAIVETWSSSDSKQQLSKHYLRPDDPLFYWREEFQTTDCEQPHTLKINACSMIFGCIPSSPSGPSVSNW